MRSGCGHANDGEHRSSESWARATAHEAALDDRDTRGEILPSAREPLVRRRRTDPERSSHVVHRALLVIIEDERFTIDVGNLIECGSDDALRLRLAQLLVW